MDLALSPSVSASCCGSLLLTLKYFCFSACGRLAPLAPWTHFLHIFSVKWEWPACTERLHCRFFLPSPEHFTLRNVFCSVCPSSGKTVTWREGKFCCLCSLLLSPFGWESPSCSVFWSVPMTGGHDSTYFGARHRIAVLIKFSVFPQRASVPLILILSCSSFCTLSASAQELCVVGGFRESATGVSLLCFWKNKSLLCWSVKRLLYFLRACWHYLTEQFGSSTCWKKILLGEIISDTNEKRSLVIAQKICQYFIEETNAMLQKVCF